MRWQDTHGLPLLWLGKNVLFNAGNDGGLLLGSKIRILQFSFNELDMVPAGSLYDRFPISTGDIMNPNMLNLVSFHVSAPL